MLDIARNGPSDSDPANQTHSCYQIGVGGALRTSYLREEFCFQAKVEEGHGGGAYSPTLWKNNNDNNSYEFSPLLPCDHQYSNLSPRTRLQAIAEARKELMEMIRDMPESSYELSLKDIVDGHHQKMEDDIMDVTYERSLRFETEAQIKKMHKEEKKKKKKNSSGSNKFSRSASMESEIFLIKMFFNPSCFGSKKNNIITHKSGSSKVSPRNSFEIHEVDHKQPRIKRIFSAGEDKNKAKIFSSSSNSDSISTSRLASKYFSPGCWPFLQIKKSKARKQSGMMYF